jgi:hypothetical protein
MHEWLQLVRDDVDPVVYGGAAAVLAGVLGVHVGTGAFEPFLRDPGLIGLVGRALLFGLPWAAVLALMVARGRAELSWPLVRMALAAVAIVAVATWFPYHRAVVAQLAAPLQGYGRAVLWNLKGSVLWLVPVLLFWWRYDRPEVPACYGVVWPTVHRRLYGALLLGTVVLAAWASFRPDFLAVYPTYRPGSAEAYLGVSPWLTVGVYELVYGVDFLFVELFFRGFLVVGMARWLGSGAVMPMVAMYAIAHVGKPVPEVLGSIVGGYLLGMLAYKSRSIAGGIVLHLGMAWSMEALAWAQHAVRGTLMGP